jgi:6-phosphogluconolactonase (cycloisomerase 2 family)
VTLSSISVTPASASVVAGLSLQFTATGSYSDGTTKDLTASVNWTSSDTAKAIISATSGLVTGKAAGTSTITATYTNATTGSVSGSNTLTVAPPNLVSVTISPNKPTLGINKNAQFYAIGTYTDNSTAFLTSGVTWTSSDTTILNIDSSSGAATAQNLMGNAVVSASLTGFTIAPVTVTVTATVYAYATNFDSNNVSQYKIESNGTLTALATGTVATDNQPYSISVEPTGEYVYVSNWNSSSVSQFRIGADGTLTKIGTGSVATGSFPNAVTIGPTDRYAYVANLGENTISQYSIGIDGQLAPMGTPKVAAGANPATIVVDPTNHFAYAGNFGANAHDPPTGPSTISLFTVSQTDGSLTAMPGAAATAPSGSGPSAIVIDPSAKYLYAANLGDNTINQYTINADGTLSSIINGGAPAGTVNTGLRPAGMAIDPTGHFVYVAGQNDGTVSQYTVGTDGGLTPMPTAHVFAGVAPSSVTVDPTGKYVYVTNRGDTTISEFSIDGTTGALTPLATVQAGTHPTALATGY